MEAGLFVAWGGKGIANRVALLSSPGEDSENQSSHLRKATEHETYLTLHARPGVGLKTKRLDAYERSVRSLRSLTARLKRPRGRRPQIELRPVFAARFEPGVIRQLFI